MHILDNFLFCNYFLRNNYKLITLFLCFNHVKTIKLSNLLKLFLIRVANKLFTQKNIIYDLTIIN